MHVRFSQTRSFFFLFIFLAAMFSIFIFFPGRQPTRETTKVTSSNSSDNTPIEKAFLMNGNAVLLPLDNRWRNNLPPTSVPEYRLPSNLSLSCATYNGTEVVPTELRRKIFLFTVYNGEADWLEAKIDEAYPVVDYIVILESKFDFREKEKPIYFSMDDPRFRPFQSKLILHIYNLTKRTKKYGKWTMEHKARDEAYNAVKHLIQPGDWIIQTDTDEVIRREALQLLRDCDFGNKTVVVFTLDFTYFGFDLDVGVWLQVAALVYRRSIGKKLFKRKPRAGIVISQAGWHCSWCFPVSGIIHKLETFSHSELDRKEVKDLNHIKKEICAGRNFFHANVSASSVESPSSFNRSFKKYCVRSDCISEHSDLPAFVLRNAAKFWYAIPGMRGGVNCSSFNTLTESSF
jgi:beta-1,4-mannosyl-glycoprotein beta-1,4-N-acetylglucosaminyltransferase